MNLETNLRSFPGEVRKGNILFLKMKQRSPEDQSENEKQTKVMIISIHD